MWVQRLPIDARSVGNLLNALQLGACDVRQTKVTKRPSPPFLFRPAFIRT
jgi:hypothetical protein